MHVYVAAYVEVYRITQHFDLCRNEKNMSHS